MDPAKNPPCPKCKKIQSRDDSLKDWTMRNAEVSQYHCVCGQFFNFYIGKNNIWTIPKMKE